MIGWLNIIWKNVDCNNYNKAHQPIREPLDQPIMALITEQNYIYITSPSRPSGSPPHCLMKIFRLQLRHHDLSNDKNNETIKEIYYLIVYFSNTMDVLT